MGSRKKLITSASRVIENSHLAGATATFAPQKFAPSRAAWQLPAYPPFFSDYLPTFSSRLNLPGAACQLLPSSANFLDGGGERSTIDVDKTDVHENVDVDRLTGSVANDYRRLFRTRKRDREKERDLQETQENKRAPPDGGESLYLVCGHFHSKVRETREAEKVLSRRDSILGAFCTCPSRSRLSAARTWFRGGCRRRRRRRRRRPR